MNTAGLRNRRRLVALLVAVVVILGGSSIALGDRPHQVHVSADFSQTVGLYAGDDVRVAGVPIGRVTAVTPHGTGVRVDMVIDAATPVAADTEAVIVPPGVLSSRYVQLTEPWTSGPTLADGAELDQTRTAAPLELDDVSRELNAFLEAIGTQRPGGKGALARVVAGSARALDGNGAQLRTTLGDLAAALSTLGDSSTDIVATIKGLHTFVDVLDRSDADIREVETNLAAVSTQLASQRSQIRRAIRSVGMATEAIDAFVKQNGANLTTNIRELATLSTTLHDRQRELIEILDLMPLGAQNILAAGNTSTNTVDTRLDLTAGNTATTLCNLLQQAALSDLCPLLGAPAGDQR